MFPQTAAAAAAAAATSGHIRPCLGYAADGLADGAKEHGDVDAWLRAGTAERAESIGLMFGGENVMDAAAGAARGQIHHV